MLPPKKQLKIRVGENQTKTLLYMKSAYEKEKIQIQSRTFSIGKRGIF